MRNQYQKYYWQKKKNKQPIRTSKSKTPVLLWNVNGYSSFVRRGGLNLIKQKDTDIVILLETKKQINKKEQKQLKELGYKYIYQNLKIPGKAGVAVLCKEKPLEVSYGLDSLNKDFDDEGRIITVDFPAITFVACYFPAPRRNEKRKEYRLEWDYKFKKYISQLELKKEVIICGDINVTLDARDACVGNKEFEFYSDRLRERERIKTLTGDRYVDAFRHVYPDKIVYSWYSPKSKKEGEPVSGGRRLDYFFVDKNIKHKIVDVKYINDFRYSDHCPVILELNLDLNKSLVNPGYLNLWDEFDKEECQRVYEQYCGRISRLAKDLQEEKKSDEQKKIFNELRTLFDQFYGDGRMRYLAIDSVARKEFTRDQREQNEFTDLQKSELGSLIPFILPDNYIPFPANRFYVKSKGHQRIYENFQLSDKAVHKCLSMFAQPYMEARMSDCVYGFREGRSPLDLISDMIDYLENHPNIKWVVYVDIEDFYNRIRHKTLMKLTPFSEKIFKKVLNSPYIQKGEIKCRTRGLPLGSSLSPFLANIILLNIEDELLETIYGDKIPDIKDKGTVFRYVDDIIIFTEDFDTADRVFTEAGGFLLQRDLSICFDPDKNCGASEVSEFKFLNINFRKYGDYFYKFPSEENLKDIKYRIKKLVEHLNSSEPVSIHSVIKKTNQILIGAYNYYKYFDSERFFHELDLAVDKIFYSFIKKPPVKDEKAYYFYQNPDNRYFRDPKDKFTQIIHLSDLPLIEYKNKEEILLSENKDGTSFNQSADPEIRNVTGEYQKVYKRMDGKCPICGEPFLKNEERLLVPVESIGITSKFLDLYYIHKDCLPFITNTIYRNMPGVTDKEILENTVYNEGVLQRFQDVEAGLLTIDQKIEQLVALEDAEEEAINLNSVLASLNLSSSELGDKERIKQIFEKVQYCFEQKGYVCFRYRRMLYIKKVEYEKLFPHIPNHMNYNCINGNFQSIVVKSVNKLLDSYGL